MQYGICNLSIVSLRQTPDDTSEMVTQLLYGDHFKVLEQRKFWSKIRVAFDTVEGWVDNKQFVLIAEEEFTQIEKTAETNLSADLLSFVSPNNNNLMPIVVGSSIQNLTLLGHIFDGNQIKGIQSKEQLIPTALVYLNSPFVRGGKTPFGIDAAGLTQMVYKTIGHPLLRTAQEQSKQGEALSFIEESEPGDLAFFDDSNGIIDHVGIIMQDNYIIHAYGKVRIDRIDHTGIFNTEIKNYTHKLRVIKKII